MEDYTIKETYTLPSGGRLYAKAIPAKETLRSMTTADEMARLNSQQNGYKAICDMIDNCRLDKDKSISCYDMCLGDYLFLLHKLRVVTYGSDYKMACTCPVCRVTTTETIDLDSLVVNEYNDAMAAYFTIDLERCGKTVTLNYQTPRMLDDINDRIAEMKRKTNGKFDRGLAITLQFLIKEIDGKVPNVIELEEFCQNMPMKDANRILKATDRINTAIGLDLDIEVDCGVCGNTYHTTFRQTGEFFGPSEDF